MNNQFHLLNEQQISALTNLSSDLNREQLLWIAGYFQGMVVSQGKEITESVPNTDSQKQLKILYGTHTGRSKSIATQLLERMKSAGVKAEIISLEDYNIRELSGETNLIIVVSTHGEGEPPVMAEDFYNFVTSKRLPQLKNLNFSVVALGDKSYRHFCKTGIDIATALTGSGATELKPVLKLDVDFQEDLENWIDQFAILFPGHQESAPVKPKISEQNIAEYSRKRPFRATVLDKVKITGRESDKEVYHIELSLDGSGIVYEPGDSVGILANNPPELVQQILLKNGFNGNEPVNLKDGEFTILEALTNRLEVTVLNRDVISAYQAKSRNQDLKLLLENEAETDRLLYGYDVLDLLDEFPHRFTPQELAVVLRAFQPRLYSISSSQLAVGNEVHLTVAAVRYSKKNRIRAGACSTFLADRIGIDDQISIFIEKNPAFKLPESHEIPIILIGAGTGVAPYRSFLQHREALDHKGKAWLFFGERRFRSDFLYQTEWQKLVKNGYLERIDVAFSRDQQEKIYVQNRLQEKQKEVYEWLKNGASIYLCGDMKQMARDVQQTLLRILEAEGGMSLEKAQEYLKSLKRQKRFQVDVY